jgi:hypothetical protein
MLINENHIVFNEVTYDRKELEDWYESVKEFRTDFGSFFNSLRTSTDIYSLTHRKEFRADLFDTIDTTKVLKKHIIEFEPIAKLVRRFNFTKPLSERDVDILIYKPYYKFMPHVDFHMHCGIMFPILPEIGGAPIDFYKMPEGADWERAKGYFKDIVPERDLHYSYHYSTKHPTMFNGDAIHGVNNNSHERVFLRFKCTSMTFNQVKDACNSGKFVNP